MSERDGTSSSNGVSSFIRIQSESEDSNSRSRSDQPAGRNNLNDTSVTDAGGHMYVLQQNDLENLMARAQSTYVPPAPAQTHGNGLQGLGEIPWFSGDESPATTTFEDWLATFQLIAEANRWSDARKFSILPIRLKGTAKEVYQGLDKTPHHKLHHNGGRIKGSFSGKCDPNGSFERIGKLKA